jgi:hypothetical protein
MHYEHLLFTLPSVGRIVRARKLRWNFGEEDPFCNVRSEDRQTREKSVKIDLGTMVCEDRRRTKVAQ